MSFFICKSDLTKPNCKCEPILTGKKKFRSNMGQNWRKVSNNYGSGFKFYYNEYNRVNFVAYTD